MSPEGLPFADQYASMTARLPGTAFPSLEHGFSAKPGIARGNDQRTVRRQPIAALRLAELSDATLSFGGRRVLDGVDLVLDPASIYVLLGQNGSGKTSLIRTLCGRNVLDRGQVAVLGRDPRIDRGVRHQIGFVPQNIALYPKLTVRENLVAFAAFSRGNGSKMARLDDIMRSVGIVEVIDRRVGELSGGYQRRVNLGAALMAKPALLLLDEPTVGLDAGAKNVLVSTVKSLSHEGLSILLTTHDFDVAASVANRVGLLSRGRILADGAPRELLTRYFQSRANVELCLDRPAGTTLASALELLGLTLSASGRWRAPDCGIAPDAVTPILAALSASDRCIRSLKVEEAGLKQLYDKLAPEIKDHD